jgi:hypothetical protein
MAILVKQQVLQLKIAVDNALAMQICNGCRDLSSVEAPSLLTKLTVSLKMVEDLDKQS